ncbi:MULTISPECIES: LysR family transcriptional regulator [Saccharothrix]|uniref:Transcriptional regulator n=2 Tax=Saccharothrix TaxID=2071 RepID=A0ABU0WUF4_9PSEU|nr:MULTISPECIES: LysR family transcriptional regulator [Saccharothrix]MDQ2583477.1 transcriptional regulator [Saccharothrix yanglingensis]MDR6594559.1 DNA-binding transcriptional LysR family regulator [Saccharothrix longispora]
MSIGIPQIRAFIAVSDTASFSAAAAQLGISQSAVSHAIASLERATGRQVLIRGNPVRPTLLGERLLVHARMVMASMTSMEDLAHHHDSGLRGNLVLAAPPTVCHGLLPGLLDRWRVEFPGISISLFEGDDDEVTGWLTGASADLAVVVDPAGTPPGAVLLAEDRFHAVLRTDHPLAESGAVDVTDLEDDPFLLSLGGCERHIQELQRSSGARLNAVHRVRQLGTLFAMVRAGIGVSIVPGLAAGMEGPDLVLVPLVQRISRELILTGPRNRPWHPATGALLASVEQQRAA